MSQNTSHADALVADQKLRDGIKSNQQSFPTLVVGGKPVVAADVIVMLQARIDSINRAIQAKTAWTDAVKAVRETRATSQAVIAAVRQAYVAATPDSADTLGQY